LIGVVVVLVEVVVLVLELVVVVDVVEVVVVDEVQLLGPNLPGVTFVASQ
jgi:hypothetical protein